MSLEALIAKARLGFQQRYGEPCSHVAWAPGRINLIGEHTDYTGGLCMPAAIDRHVVCAIRPISAPVAHFYSVSYTEELDLPLPVRDAPTEGWGAYAAGAVAVFQEALVQAGRSIGRGVEVLILGDVPLGAGLSSSAAIECALLGALKAAFSLPLSDLTLAQLAQQVEHRFLGLKSGLLDPYASQLSRAGNVMVIDFRTLQHQYVPADMGPWCWLVIDTGVRRALAASAYGERVRSCQEGLAALRMAGAAHHLRDATVDMVESIGGGAPWVPRLRHVIRENARVEAAARALTVGDHLGLGRLLVESHESLRQDYSVSCPELDRLVDVARGQPGWAGGRMIGGGFGGCTLHLVRAEAAEALAAHISDAFEDRFKRPAPSWRFRLVGGAGASR